MGKKKGQLPVLLLILAVCIGGYAGITAYRDHAAEQKKAADEAAKVYLSDLSQITNLSFRNSNGTFVFHREEDAWYYSSDQGFPLKQSKLSGIVNTLESLTAIRAFEPSDSLSAYGLDEPACTLTAIDADGNTLTLLFGGTTGSNCYVMEQDGDTIYTISSTLITYLDCTLNDLVELETFPAVSEENISSVVLASGTDTLTLEKDTIAAGTGPEEENDESNSTEYVWYVVSRDGVRTPVEELAPASGENASDLMDQMVSKLSSLAFTGCENYKAGEELLSACGLDAPALTLTVNYSDSKENAASCASFRLAIGALNEAGNAYYAVKDSSAAINLMDAELVSVFSDVFSAFHL